MRPSVRTLSLLGLALSGICSRGAAECEPEAFPNPPVGFGSAIAVNSEYVLVGAGGNDTNATNAGAAFLYDALTSQTLLSIYNPDPAPDDWFGSHVALSGNYILIGAYADDTGAPNAGSAYLYDASSGDLIHTFNNPAPADGDRMGVGLAITGDDVFVGVPYHANVLGVQGRVHQYNAVSGALVRTIENPYAGPDPGTTAFGIAIAAEGDTIVIGDFLAGNFGAAHSYHRATGALLQTYNNPTPAGLDGFGVTVGISGDRVIIGSNDRIDGVYAGSAYIFDRAGGSLLREFNNPNPTEGANFGYPIAIQGDIALIGAPYDDTDGANTGLAYLFDIPTGAILRLFHDPAPAANRYFGNNVALLGPRAFISAPGPGEVFIFDLDCQIPSPTPTATQTASPTPSPSQTETPSPSPTETNTISPTPSASPTPSITYTPTPSDTLTLGRCLQLERTINDPTQFDYFAGHAVSVSGNKILVGWPYHWVGELDRAGRAYVFDINSGALLHTLHDSTPGNWELFGSSVCIWGDDAVVGGLAAEPAGQAHLFNASTGALVRTFHDPVQTIAGFGRSVAIREELLVIGAHNFESIGRAYLFNKTTGAHQVTFSCPSQNHEDEFGWVVAISENRVVVGAPNGAGKVGVAYLFDTQDGSLIHTLNNPHPALNSRFGHAVAIWGDNVLVGAPSPWLYNGQGGPGRAYVFSAVTGGLRYTVPNPSPEPFEEFGHSVSIDENSILVGAYRDNTWNLRPGAVYRFNASTGMLLDSLIEPVHINGFGMSVALAAGRVVVGSQDLLQDRGRVYIYNCIPQASAANWTRYE